MEAVSIVIQRPLIPFYPVVKDEFQFRSLNFTQKFLNVLNASEKILWPRELLSCQYRLHVPQKPEVRSQKMPSQDCKADGVLEQSNFQRKICRGL
jgi:hypothetical protein